MIATQDYSQPSHHQVRSVIRGNLLRTLDLLLETNQIVVVEGPAGMGKSTLLHQFVNAHESQVISLFISGASRWAYDPWQIQHDLYSQLTAILGLNDDREPHGDWRLTFAALYSQLHKRAIRSGQTYYFVVDGLEDIPAADEATKLQIIDLLPFGYRPFRFVLSAIAAADLPLAPAARNLVKVFPLPFFSPDEVARYFEDLPLTPEQLAEITKTTSGLPAKLASIRRLLVSGTRPDELLSKLPEQLPDLFDLEWRVVSHDDTALHLALALLAHDNRAYTSEEIADITGISATELRSKLDALPFLEQDERGYYRFPTDLTRGFVAAKLNHLRQRVNDLLISHLSKDPDSPEAIAQLPALYFTDPERLRDLLHFLSPERFARLYKDSPSIKLIQQQADRGIEAARKLNLTPDLVRFTLHRSTIEEIAHSRVAAAEVRARAAVGDIETALALAEAAPRSELRLELLVAAASVLKEQGRDDYLELLPRIKELLEAIDTDSLGSRLPDVAGDLFQISPELAIELVTRPEGTARGEDTLDWARARLAIQAQVDAHLAEADPNAWKRARDLQEQIKDPTLRRLSLHVVAVLGRLSARDVIAEAARFDSAADRVFLLQHWMVANRTRPDAPEVLEQAVRYALQSTDYTASARVYRDLALCLPHVSEPERAMELVELLDAQRGVLEKIGPVEDYIRLRLIIARTVCRHDPAAGQDRLEEIYNEIAAIEDPVVKAAATARLAAALARVDPERLMDDTLHQLVEQDLTAVLKRALEQSAEHHDVCRGVIQALAVARPADALAVVEMINTEHRRDLGYASFVEAATAGPLDEIPVPHVLDALSRIVDPDILDAAVEGLAFSLAGRLLSPELIPALEPLLERVTEIWDLRLRVRACAALAGALSEAGPNAASLRRKLLDAAWKAWTSMDASWERLETGLTALASVAHSDSAEAQRYIDEINILKHRLHLPDADSATAATLTVMLAIRAFAGIVRQELDTRDDLERLYNTIGLCGSSLDQARLLTDLAVRSYFAGRVDLCQEIAQQKLIPLIDSVPPEDRYYRRELVITSAPALYFGSPSAFRAHVRRLDPIAQDDALATAAWTLLTRTPPSDPYDHRPRTGYNINYEQACAIAEIIRDMTTDWRIYGLIEAVVESALLPGARINRAQRQQLADILDEIASSKLPSPRFIRHRGYLIIARAQINRLRIGPTAASPDLYAEEARRLPNTADQAFVLAVIGALVPEQKARRRLLSQAREITAGIPILADRLDRYELMSNLFAHSEPAVSKELLTEAIRLATRGEGKSVEARRRALINAAYRVDPDFAATLAQLSDDDPAKSQIERQMAIYRLRDAIAARRPKEKEPASATPIDYARAAWLRLALLNADRIGPVGPERTLPLLQYAARQRLSEGYPLVAFFIENAVREAKSGGAVRTYVLPLFEACLRASELALFAARPTDATVTRGSLTLKETSAVIDAGEREKALAILSGWLAQQPADTEFLIVEPYFKPDDVHLLALISDSVDNPRVTIITGPKSVEGLTAPYDEHYRSAWRKVRQEPLPETTVIIVATRETKRFPLHDRWWLTRSGGVELGTSFGGLGLRVSKIRELETEEAQAVLSMVSPYFMQQRIEYSGERVLYSMFMLE